MTREIDVWGRWEIYTLHSACAWVREIARVRAGGADYLEETSSVCVGEGCESARDRES